MKKFKDLFEQHREKGRFKPVKPHNVASVAVTSPRPTSDSANVKLKEDLRQWFNPKHPKGGWKRINSKGEAVGPCAREPGEPKPKCMSNEKRAKLNKKERASAVASKRKHDPNPERKGAPINVSNFGKGKISEDMENLNEKNVPTSPEKWAQAKAQAKSKFDVYPSAYANGWAAKKYKEMGGDWKSVSEAVKDKFDIGEYDQEGDMAKSDLRSIIANAQKLHDMIEDADNLPEWCQNKITLAEDYISTVANYLTAEMNEEWSKTGKEATHRETGEKTYEYHQVDKEGKPTGKREYRNAQGKPMGESVEQIDEISKQTLGSYINKASSSIADKSAEAQHKRTKAVVDHDDNIRRGMSKKGADTHLNRGYDSAKPDINKVKSRLQGVQKATSRLTKEEVEQIEEGKMGELHADLSDHLDKHIDNYKKVGGADHLGHKTTQVATKIAKMHGIQQHHAQKFVNDYVENRLKESKDVPFDPPYTKAKGTVTDKSGAKHTPMSRARDLARQAVKKQSQNLKTNKQVVESRKSQIVKEIVRGKKKESPEKFQSDPVVTDITTKSQTM
jgi:uncharacterized protein YecT (DUF1311 family)